MTVKELKEILSRMDDDVEIGIEFLKLDGEICCGKITEVDVDTIICEEERILLNEILTQMETISK